MSKSIANQSGSVASKPKLSIDNPTFWDSRLQRAKDKGEIHRAIYDVSIDTWNNVQFIHKEILSLLVHPYNKCRVLDAGCGYGALLEILPTNINYTGVDISTSFLREAELRYPNTSLLSASLTDLPFPDRHFDIAIARSIEGMVIENLGISVWREMERELLRVSEILVLLNYSDPTTYTVAEPVSANDGIIYTREANGGRLTYRAGQDGTIELYDLYVQEHARRAGVATALITDILSTAYGTVYGFCRASNYQVRNMYQKLGFTIYHLPGFYRGQDGFMVVKPFIQVLADKRRESKP